MNASVSIAGLPVLIDWQHQIRNHMLTTLPSEDVLFARWLQNEVPPNPLVANASNYLETPYPELPPIRVGELQWPSGASRYARALYAVDWPTMRKIAEEAWGYDVPTELIDPEGDPVDPDNQREVLPTDVPDSWGIDHYPVDLSIFDTVREFKTPMYALPPYRITGQGIDLWLLPLVDKRFLFNRRPHTAVDTIEDWTTFLEDLATEMGTTIAVDPIPSGYGTQPDPRLYQSDQPAAELLDIAALSVGLRVIREPSTQIMRAVSSGTSITRRDNNEIDSPLLLAGGKRSDAAHPSGVEVYCMADENKFEKFTRNFPGVGTGRVRLAVWSSWFLEYDGTTHTNAASTTAFVDQLSTDVQGWLADAGSQFCWAGAKEYQPNGFDDYLSIQVFERETNAKEYSGYIFTSRIYELPPVFLPPAILVNGRICEEELFQYQLVSNWFGGLAVAYKRDMDGIDKRNPYVLVRDPLGVFAFQKKGYKGYMRKQCGKYYAIQSPCPPTTPAPDPEPPSGTTGACCIPVSLEYVCQITTQEQCTAAGGTYQGDGTTCDPFPC